MTQAATQSMPPVGATRFAEAHDALLADKSIQFEMTPMQMPEPPDWLVQFLEFLASPVAKVLLWGIVAIIVLFIVALVLNRLVGLRLPWKKRSVADEPGEESWQPEAEPARALLREADALAEEGRFDEAAHLLLFRSIEDIESRRPRLVRPALTSRDIAGAAEIPVPARTAFGAIVMMVERSLFGGRQLSEPDWRECRTAYEHFAFAGAWR